MSSGGLCYRTHFFYIRLVKSEVIADTRTHLVCVCLCDSRDIKLMKAIWSCRRALDYYDNDDDVDDDDHHPARVSFVVPIWNTFFMDVVTAELAVEVGGLIKNIKQVPDVTWGKCGLSNSAEK